MKHLEDQMRKRQADFEAAIARDPVRFKRELIAM